MTTGQGRTGNGAQPIKKQVRIPVIFGIVAVINFALMVWSTAEFNGIQQQVKTCNQCLVKANELRFQLLSDEVTSSDVPNPTLCQEILEQDKALLIKLRVFSALNRARKASEEAHVSFGKSHSSSAALVLSSSLARLINEMSSVQEELRNRIEQLQLVQYASYGVQLSIIAALVWLSIRTMQREAQSLASVDQGLKAICSGKSPNTADAPVQVAASLTQLASMISEIRRNEHAVVSNALDVICTIDDANRFAMVNPSSLRVLGYTPEEIIGRRVQEFVADGKEDDNIGMLVGTSKSMARVSMEMQWRKKDGSVVTLLWSAYWSSGSETLFCVVHDITDRKKAEQILKESESKLRAILQGMPVAVLVENHGLIEYANNHALTLSGYSAEELMGEMLSILSPIGSRTIESCLENKVEGAEISLIRRNGENFQAELYSSPLGSGTDDSRRLVMFVDVTERHKMEQLKREFLAMAGHELRTPLTSIRVTLSSVADGVYGNLSERGKDLINRCEGELIRLVSLVGDMLDAERMRSGKLQLAKSELSIISIADAAVAAVKPVAIQRNIEVISRCEDLHMIADGAKLIQVLINLLSNAIKFSPAQSQITVSAKALPGRIRLEVRDKGRGIPPGYEKLIFEQFSQVEKGDAGKGRGAGLGLSICKSIVEAHGGVIGVDSQFGRGSVFWIELPQHDDEETDEAGERE